MHNIIAKLIIYGNLDKDSILYNLGDIYRRFTSGEATNGELINDIYAQVRKLLVVATDYGFDKNLWHNYLTFLLITNENPFSITCEKVGANDGSVNAFAKNDFSVFMELFNCDFKPIEKALGIGVLSVIKDIGLKEPYVGDTILVTSDVTQDITYYFATSEQVPTSVGLSVIMSKDNTVKSAGGFIIQLLPDASEEIISALEKKIKEVKNVTTMLEHGYTPEQMLEELLGEFGLDILDKIPTQFYCNCSKERMSRALISIGRKELSSLIEEGRTIEVNCHFCGSHYNFDVEELKDLLHKAVR